MSFSINIITKIHKINAGKSNPHASGKSFETGIVPVARHNHPLPRLSIHCSKIANTNAIKIKHFHMLHVCTNLNVLTFFVNYCYPHLYVPWKFPSLFIDYNIGHWSIGERLLL